MYQEDMIYTSKVISIHYHGNIIDSNHGNGTQPNKDFKTLLKAPSQWPSSLIYGHEFLLLEHDTVEEKSSNEITDVTPTLIFQKKIFQPATAEISSFSYCRKNSVKCNEK